MQLDPVPHSRLTIGSPLCQTSASKDQHRSVKTAVSSRLNAAFKPVRSFRAPHGVVSNVDPQSLMLQRRQTAFADGKLIVPTSPESETSTLVSCMPTRHRSLCRAVYICV